MQQHLPRLLKAFACSLILLLSSCGPWSAPPSTSGTRQITVMASDGWIYDVIGEHAKLFEKETGIRVSFTNYAPHVYFRALGTLLDSGEVTDIFLMQSTQWYLGTELDPTLYCLDLTDEEWTGRLKPEWLPTVSHQQRVYGLVLWDDSTGWVYTYNDKIFRRLGLSVPRTTQEFLEVCAALKAAGINPIYEPGASRWHSSLTFFEMGATFEERDPGLYDRLNNNRLKFADYPPFRKALDQILLAMNRGYFGENFMANTLEGAKAALISETSAMTLNKIGFSRSVLRTNPDSGAETWGMFPIPWLDNRTVSIERSAPTWFGNAKTRDPDAVRQFFRFLSRQENLDRYAELQPEGTSLSFPTAPRELQSNEKSFFATNPMGGEPFQGGVKYIMSQWMEIEADFEQMLAGALSPSGFLQQVDKRRANLARANGDPAWTNPTSP